MVPACYFAQSSGAHPARSTFQLRNRSLVCPSPGCFHASSPLHSAARLRRLCRQSSLPFGNFHSRRLNASIGFATFRSAFRNRPTFVRSPQPFHFKIRLRIIVRDPLAWYPVVLLPIARLLPVWLPVPPLRILRLADVAACLTSDLGLLPDPEVITEKLLLQKLLCQVLEVTF